MPRRIGAAISHSRRSSADEIVPFIFHCAGKPTEVQASAAREIFASRSRKRGSSSPP
jgi:hypothetical protein